MRHIAIGYSFCFDFTANCYRKDFLGFKSTDWKAKNCVRLLKSACSNKFGDIKGLSSNMGDKFHGVPKDKRNKKKS